MKVFVVVKHWPDLQNGGTAGSVGLYQTLEAALAAKNGFIEGWIDSLEDSENEDEDEDEDESDGDDSESEEERGSRDQEQSDDSSEEEKTKKRKRNTHDDDDNSSTTSKKKKEKKKKQEKARYDETAHYFARNVKRGDGCISCSVEDKVLSLDSEELCYIHLDQ